MNATTARCTEGLYLCRADTLQHLAQKRGPAIQPQQPAGLQRSYTGIGLAQLARVHGLLQKRCRHSLTAHRASS